MHAAMRVMPENAPPSIVNIARNARAADVSAIFYSIVGAQSVSRRLTEAG